jgi:hypothetical protein
VADAWVNTALPVRSAVLKQDTGGLVVRWVTTSESPLLYVLELFVRRNSRLTEGGRKGGMTNFFALMLYPATTR